MDLIKETLPRNLDDILEQWQDNYDSNYEPGAYYEPLKTALDTFRTQFSNEPDIIYKLDHAISEIESAIFDLNAERETPGDDDYYDYESRPATYDKADRSIFDDVDE
jgi:hypothetical protein